MADRPEVVLRVTAKVGFRFQWISIYGFTVTLHLIIPVTPLSTLKIGEIRAE
jgi:hypothetical protein